jgi:hypothetical protein
MFSCYIVKIYHCQIIEVQELCFATCHRINTYCENHAKTAFSDVVSATYIFICVSGFMTDHVPYKYQNISYLI